MSYLNSVAENAEVNLMTRQNIAIVFGPSLLRTNTSDPILNFSRTGSLSDIVECMIEYHKDFFEVCFIFNAPMSLTLLMNECFKFLRRKK